MMNDQPPASIVILLAVVVAVYVAIGSLYAALTPAWQVPDEPAHYNYIRSLAEGRGFPVLEQGDYDQAYLRRLTTDGFPAELSIEPLEYEDHQPPLYYLLASPVYLLSDGALLPLRLLSVVFGAGLLIVAFGTVRASFPNRPALGLIVAAFIAFIPQHVAMTAAVNNDTLAELVVGGALWALVVYAGSGSPPSSHEEQRPGPVHGSTERRPWHVGLLLAAALLTKTTAYIVVGVAVAAVALRWRCNRRTVRWAAGQLAWILVPAVLLSAPWFIRNGLTYGWADPLGLARHEAIVEGQPQSSEWLAAYGWRGLLSRMARTTFQSFWGQFGWMAVPLPQRIYQILLLLSILIAAGFVTWLVRACRTQSANPSICQPTSLLVLSALLTFSAFGWYNLTFVQHQGRYLFPALIPLATAAALGLRTIVDILPRQLRAWALIAFFAALAAFDGYCLFKIILPNL